MTVNVARQRGFGLSNYPYSFAFVLVKAGVDEVSRALATLLGKDVVTDLFEKRDEIKNRHWMLFVWQYVGHDWTIFGYSVCQEDVPRLLSETLSTDCIYFEYEKVSSWEGYSLFRDGDLLESYDFGPDYSEEIADHFEEMGWEMSELAPKIPYDIDTTDGSEQFLFRSTLRTVSEDEIKNYKAFYNDFFLNQDAWLPDWDDTLWIEEGSLFFTEESIFVRVDGLTHS